jgi:hypothetical protein
MRELRIVNKFSGNLEMRMRVDGADTRHESVPRLSRGSPVDPLFSMRSDDGAAACSGVMRLTNRDMELLRELRAARWLTTTQIRRRFFTQASLSAAHRRLRKLVVVKYLVRYQEDRMHQAMFTLGPEGKRFLERYENH